MNLLAAFLASVNSLASLLDFGPLAPHAHGLRTSLQPTLDAFTRLTITAPELSFCVTASFHGQCRNLHLPPIAYDFRPRLRSRLTLGG